MPGLPFLAARYDEISEPVNHRPEVEALVTHIRGQAQEALELLPQAPPELAASLNSIESPSMLADLVSGLLDINPAEKQSLLETIEIKPRLERLLELMTHRLQVLKISKEIGEQTQEKLDARQREFVLREQLKTIQKELCG